MTNNDSLDLFITFLHRIPGNPASRLLQFPANISCREMHFTATLIRKRISELWSAEEEENSEVVVTLGNLFVSRVERIEDKEIYAIGIELASESFNRLRKRCRDSINAEMGYEGPGHISICYVLASEAESSRLLVEQNLRIFNGYTFPLHQIELIFPDKVTHVSIPRALEGFGGGRRYISCRKCIKLFLLKKIYIVCRCFSVGGTGCRMVSCNDCRLKDALIRKRERTSDPVSMKAASAITGLYNTMMPASGYYAAAALLARLAPSVVPDTLSMSEHNGSYAASDMYSYPQVPNIPVSHVHAPIHSSISTTSSSSTAAMVISNGHGQGLMNPSTHSLARTDMLNLSQHQEPSVKSKKPRHSVEDRKYLRKLDHLFLLNDEKAKEIRQFVLLLFLGEGCRQVLAFKCMDGNLSKSTLLSGKFDPADTKLYSIFELMTTSFSNQLGQPFPDCINMKCFKWKAHTAVYVATTLVEIRKPPNMRLPNPYLHYINTSVLKSLGSFAIRDDEESRIAWSTISYLSDDFFYSISDTIYTGGVYTISNFLGIITWSR